MQIAEGATPMIMSSDGAMGSGMWIWAFLLFALLGNGNGFGGNNGQNSLWQSQQFSQIDNGIRSLGNGICDSSFALNNSIKDGINAIGNGLCTTTYELASKIDQARFDSQKCCCETQRGIDGVNYNVEKSASAIIQANTAGYQKILDALCGMKNDELQYKLNQRDRELSEARIIASMKPQAPIPAYSVPSPYGVYSGYGCNGCC